ncbi:MAG: arylsulfatase [Verrucomicrobiota bacterium]
MIIGISASATSAATASQRPNIVFLLADDLGYGDIGAFGQTKIRTPNLDRLAADGMKLTQHYAGHNVCAPSRCVLMTGKHPGHAYIRANRGGIGIPGGPAEGQEPVPAGELQLPLTLKKLGYTIGGFGKWGLGAVGSSGDPQKHGFDRFFGFNDQAHAHNHYTTYLWDNDRKVTLKNPEFNVHDQALLKAEATPLDVYQKFTGPDYAPDLIAEKAREFLRDNRSKPFFLYYPTTVPHLAYQVPEDSLAEYLGKFPEPSPATGNYQWHRAPRAAYAAMITRMDRDIGKLLAMIDEFGLRENTIVVFTSDNGGTGPGIDFFNSVSGLRGKKGNFYEGGFREPCIVRWTGKIKPGSTSDRVTGFEDWLPTLLELAGAANETPKGIDGISFAPTLRGQAQAERPFLYRESPATGGQQAVRVGNWKGIRPNVTASTKLELYDLAKDPKEEQDIAAQNPDVVARLTKILEQQHMKSVLFPLPGIDAPAPGADAKKKKKKG